MCGLHHLSLQAGEVSSGPLCIPAACPYPASEVADRGGCGMGTKGTRLHATVASAPGAGGNNSARAQSYPDRRIKIVVPYPPGGPADVAARLVTQPLSSRLGQSVIVENQPGAGGRTGAKAVAQAS